jgi:O-antigen ligase
VSPGLEPIGRAEGAISRVFLTLVVGLLVPGLLACVLATTKELAAVALVIALLGLLIIIARPFWGLIFFAALLYIRPEESIPALQGMRFTLLVSLVTLGSLLLQLCLNREAFVRHPLNGWLAGFACAAVLSTLNTGNTAQAAQDFGKLVVLALLVLNLVRTPDRYRALVTALLCLTGYLAAYSIFLYFTGQAMVTAEADRSEATGIFGDPNDLAATLVAGLALTLSRLPRSSRPQRIPLLLLSCLIIWAVLLTNSRGGMLALLIVLGGLLLAFQKRKVLSITLAVLVIGGFLTFGPSRMTSFDSEEESANMRFWFWANGVDMLKSQPLTGVGYGQFPDLNGGMTAHNSFVLCFAELGLTGYFFWMGCLYYCFRKMPQEPVAPDQDETARSDLLGARLALAGFLVACFWLSRTYTPVMYLLMSLAVVARTAYSEEQRTLLTGKERAQDALRITLLCLGSILYIKMMSDYLR